MRTYHLVYDTYEHSYQIIYKEDDDPIFYKFGETIDGNRLGRSDVENVVEGLNLGAQRVDSL